MTVRARLPSNIEKGAVGGAGFKTIISAGASGHEQRAILWDRARGQWDIGYGIRNKESLAVVIAHHRACFARAYPFLFKDWSDFQASNEAFGTGNGSTTQFQLTLTYRALADDNSVVHTYVRNINAPLASSVVISNNGTPVSGGSFDLLDGGIISFHSAPANTHTLTWSGEFDNIVRYDVDQLKVSMQLASVGAISGISIVEVLDE